MKIAVVSTTINVPIAARLLVHIGAKKLKVFITGDEKTPKEAYDFCRDKPCIAFYTPAEQEALGYACSDLIGYSTIGRRNIALLEAIKWGADIFVLWDDDNIPINNQYFYDFLRGLEKFNGPAVSGAAGWFDVGQLFDPVSPHRGFPYVEHSNWRVEPVTNARVGVAAGACLGDPDISAVDRISRSPMVHNVSELLRAGIVVEPSTRTVFNSQNTAFVRELAPAFLMVPQFKRYDDILASLVAQRVMRERDLHVHFGKPFAYQQRNLHNLLRDLDAEVWGMNNIRPFAQALDEVTLAKAGSVLEHVEQLYAKLAIQPWMLPGVGALVKAWIKDLRSLGAA